MDSLLQDPPRTPTQKYCLMNTAWSTRAQTMHVHLIKTQAYHRG